ncbi:MAG: preprotein translocase subunit SecE [Thermodesulfobacteriota bacterium]
MIKIKNISDQTIDFFKDVEVEAKRITWPSRNEAIKSTLAVVFISAIFASFLGLIDFVFSLVVKSLIG